MGLVNTGRTLLISITDHRFVKRELKILALLLKSVKKFLSWIIRGMQGAVFLT